MATDKKHHKAKVRKHVLSKRRKANRHKSKRRGR